MAEKVRQKASNQSMAQLRRYWWTLDPQTTTSRITKFGLRSDVGTDAVCIMWHMPSLSRLLEPACKTQVVLIFEMSTQTISTLFSPVILLEAFSRYEAWGPTTQLGLLFRIASVECAQHPSLSMWSERPIGHFYLDMVYWTAYGCEKMRLGHWCAILSQLVGPPI